MDPAPWENALMMSWRLTARGRKVHGNLAPCVRRSTVLRQRELVVKGDPGADRMATARWGNVKILLQRSVKVLIALGACNRA